MKFFQKIGKSLMIPISCMPICGILMGIGYLLCPAGMQGGEIIGIAAKIGYFLITAGGAVINHIPILFAIGVGIGMSDGEANAGLSSLVSWLMMTTLLSQSTLSAILPALAEKDTVMLALSKIENPFIGILAGLIGAFCIKKFQSVRLPSWLSFFSGKRLGIIISGLVSIAVSAALFVIWPMMFSGLVWFGQKIAEMGNLGSAIYVTLNRLLIPFGLHHALNNVFWFDTIGLGDLTAFWSCKTSADVSWSVGMYMSGFFPSMMFGIPAAALAMHHSAKRKDKRTSGMLFSSALSAFVCGVTEPFEFSFMFASPVLYLIYSVLFGAFTFVANALGFRAGFSFSAGIIDLIFSASLPAAQKTLLIIPLGIAAFAVYYLVFRVIIKKFDLKTPGREDDSEDEEDDEPAPIAGVSAETARAVGIIQGLGGTDNILSVTNCATRLRVDVKDNTICNDKAINKAGAAGVMKIGTAAVQVIIGLDVEFVAAEVNRLLKSGLPLPTDTAEKVPAPADVVIDTSNDTIFEQKTNSVTLSGKCGNGGIAVGTLFLKPECPLPEKTTVADIPAELARFEETVAAVKADLLATAATADRESAPILEAQAMMLEDTSFTDPIREKIQSGINADFAAFEAGNEAALAFEQMEDAYMKARAADVRHVAEKISLSLRNLKTAIAPDVPCILVAEEVTPEQLIGLDKTKILGLVTRKGSANAHTSILAGNYGIPYVYGVEFETDAVETAAAAALDAENGQFVLSPDEDTQRKFYEKQHREQAALAAAEQYSGTVKVYANIARPEDVEDVLAEGADGIGLFRTEFLYMNRKTLPDEEEQFAAYKTVLENMNGGEVIIRTMDIGADKQTDCIKQPNEENPALGRRAIRLCLEDTDLFRTQLRAIFRAAVYGNAAIMYPMIASVDELDAIREQVEAAAKELDDRGENYQIPPQGIMIETPAAAVISDQLAEKVDFFSIGTNDLCQYTLALDRQAQGLDRFYHPDHEAVLRLIALTVKNAHEKGVRVGICGELGGDAQLIPKFHEMGIDELSMSPKKIKKAKSVLANLPTATPSQPAAASEAFVGFEEIGAPADGVLVPMQEIPDEAFASGVLGKCVGVIPENGNIYAPCNGTVTMVAQTLHAIGIHTASGHDVLLHVGINTVTLGGNGFACSIQAGDTVAKNDRIMTVDLDVIRKADLDPTVIVAVSDGE